MRLVTTFIQNTEYTDPDLSYLNRARFVLSVADGHGSDGVGILDAVIRNRHLFLSMTSGAEIDAGSVFTEDDLPVASDSRLGIAAFDPAYFSILAGKVSLRGDLDFGLNETQLAEYLTANKYATQAWVAAQGFIGSDGLALYATKEWVLGQNFAKASSLGNYLLKSVWDEVFEVTTVNGVQVLNVKLDIAGLKGISAYGLGSTSGGFSGALVDLVDVAVTNLASGDILKYNGTHFVNVPVSSIAGASSWDQITGKPEYYPTRWADVSGAPTSLPASDVYPWAKAASKPTYTAAEVGALALSGGTLTGNVITIGSFILANSGAYPQLTFRATTDNSERLLFRHGNDLKWRYNGTNDGIIYHSGNFNPSSKLDKSVWDEAFEIKTVDGVRVISAKLDFLSVAGISAYATGPSSGGGGGGLDYDLLKQALTGAITPDGYPFTISTSFLGAIDKTYLTGKLANTYANKVHTHLWADITDRPTSLPANGGNAESAIKDGNGNVIANTYLPLSGGSITGGLGVSGYLTAGVLKINETGSVYPQILFTGNNGNSSLLFVNAISRELVFRPADGVANDGIVYHSKNLTKLSQLTNDVVPSWALATTNHYLPYDDTHNTNYAPYNSNISKGLTTVHMKTTGIDGLADGGNFHSSIYITPWMDASGGHAHNIAFTDNGNMWMRHGTASWSEWVKVYHSSNSNLSTVDWAAKNITAAGTVTAPTFVGNLSGSASSVNGYDINSFTGYYKYTIDASSLDQNTYYPVTMYLGNHNTVRISVIVALDSGTKPAWSPHASGYSVRFIEEVNGSGWGASEVSRNILANEYRFANANPVGRVEQMTNSSTEVIWVRGGGKYFFYLSIPYITPALRTSTFTNSSQSVSPRTDTMDLRMAANGNGIAVSKLYAHNSIEINGFTIDVYNGALRVNGNLVATGGVASLATA